MRVFAEETKEEVIDTVMVERHDDPGKRSQSRRRVESPTLQSIASGNVDEDEYQTDQAQQKSQDSHTKNNVILTTQFVLFVVRIELLQNKK